MSRLNLELLKPYHAHSMAVSGNSPGLLTRPIRDDLIIPLSSYIPQRDNFTILFTKRYYGIVILASTADLAPAELDSDWENDEEHFVKPVPLKQFPLYISYPFLSPHFEQVLKGEPFAYKGVRAYAASTYTVKDWE